MSAHPQLERGQFEAWVHDALAHLYDPVHLTSHPLADLLAQEADRPQRAVALRRTVLEAIQALRPAAGVPAGSHEWRGFRILELRFIEGLSPTEAIESLHLSRSQFFREQRRVVDALGDLLWERVADQAAAAGTDGDLMDREIQRLTDSVSLGPVNARELLEGLAPMLRVLDQTTQVEITLDATDAPIALRADAALLRQALLAIASQAVHLGVPARLELDGYACNTSRGLRVTVRGPSRSRLSELATRLELAEQLVRACGGKTQVEHTGAETLSLKLLWSTRPRLLFVIDDNPEFAELYRRYLAGVPWHVENVASGAEALNRLAELDAPPDAILLDMLMPGEDGWQVLSHLRELPGLARTPVFICSVLDQPELARAMGATGMLRKPVRQDTLVEALAGV